MIYYVEIDYMRVWWYIFSKMLLEYGNTKVSPEWVVEEKSPAGYSRVYHVYSGEVEYIDERCKTYLKHDHLYIFPSNSPYRMNNNSEKRLHCTYFHIDILPSQVTELIEIPIENEPILKILTYTHIRKRKDLRYKIDLFFS